jgi:predicted aspartyl protease
MKKSGCDQRLVTNEILIAAMVLLVTWTSGACALEINAVYGLLGREKTLELAPEKMRHHLPLKVDQAFGYFMVDQGAGQLVVTREFVAEHELWDYHFVKEVTGGDLVEFKTVTVGSWTLNDVSAIICDDCQMLAGQSVLSQFTLQSRLRDGVDYLTLTR